MKFKLGQKVKYRRISKKIEIDRQFWTLIDFEEDDEKELERREFIGLDKGRTGYIAGRRKLVFKTYFGVESDNGDNFEPPTDWVDIKRQEYGYVYLIAYTMGKTNYVLEEDLKVG